jgi:hypothetical protein
MNLLLMVMRLVLGMLFPSRRDGLSLAARVDGRMEQQPQSVWSWLLGDKAVRPRESGPIAPRGRPPTSPSTPSSATRPSGNS